MALVTLDKSMLSVLDQAKKRGPFWRIRFTHRQNPRFRRILADPAKTPDPHCYSSVFGVPFIQFVLTSPIGLLERTKRRGIGRAADASHHNVKMTFLLKGYFLRRK